MKLMLFFTLFLTNMAYAGQKYVATVQTENLGFLTLELDFDFVKGKTSNAVNSYFQEYQGDRQWDDWICENKAVFKESLKITGDLSTYHGAYLGRLSNERYDMKKNNIIVSDVQRSGEEFNCELLSLKNKSNAYFEGHKAFVKVGKFILYFWLRGSEIPVVLTEIADHVYSLDSVSVNSIIEGALNSVQWSVNVDHGSYSNNYEWGYTGLSKN